MNEVTLGKHIGHLRMGTGHQRSQRVTRDNFQPSSGRGEQLKTELSHQGPVIQSIVPM